MNSAMNGWLDSPLILLLLTNLVLLGSSRLASCIRIVAVQGILLAIVTLLHGDGVTAGSVILAVGSAGLKSIVFPWLLFRALRVAAIRREVEPIVGYKTSIVFGMIFLGISLWVSGQLPIVGEAASSLSVPTALFTMLTGLFLIISRRKAITQALGYLVLENGIFCFSVTLLPEEPLLIEMGVLLDAFLAVFLMGIAIYHISREFNHIDTDQLDALRDTP